MDSESIDGLDSPRKESEAVNRLGDAKVLFVAAACVVLGAVLAAAPGIVSHVFGYTFACLITFTLVALYRRYSVERANSLGIVPPSWAHWLSIALIVVGFAVAMLNAWALAVKLS